MQLPYFDVSRLGMISNLHQNVNNFSCTLDQSPICLSPTGFGARLQISHDDRRHSVQLAALLPQPRPAAVTTDVSALFPASSTRLMQGNMRIGSELQSRRVQCHAVAVFNKPDVRAPPEGVVYVQWMAVSVLPCSSRHLTCNGFLPDTDPQDTPSQPSRLGPKRSLKASEHL